MANTRNNLILQGFGGPKLVTQGFGPDLAYHTAFYYDRKGNVTCVLDPDNGQTYYTYDKVSRMTSVKNPWGETAYYEYSPGGKLLARTLGNGCVTYYAYDRRGVTKVQNLKSDLSVISTFEYERDRTGNPLSILREDGSCVYYEYDLNQQLTAETQTDDTGAVVYAWEWDYDRAGNRLWQTFNGEATYYTYNAGNELVTEETGGVTTYYEYDRNGNQTAKQAVDGTTYFHYDFENLLRQIDLPDGAHNYFTYDADSKRVSAQDSTGYTRFIYQGPDMLKLMQERNAAGETQAQYTMGQGLESMRRGAVSSFFHYDALGSTQELTDVAEEVTDTYRYNAWGIIVKRTGGTMNPHTYVGRERYYADADPVLYMLGLRYLDAVLARFLRRDPAGDELGAYLYVENSPAVGVDPSGLQGAPTTPWDCVTTYDNWWAKCEAIFDPASRSQCMSDANAWMRRCKKRLGLPCGQWRRPIPLPVLPNIPTGNCDNPGATSDCGDPCAKWGPEYFETLCQGCCAKFAPALQQGCAKQCARETGYTPPDIPLFPIDWPIIVE